MAEKLKSISGEQLLMRIYPARQLGEEKDTIFGTIFGAIDINRINSAALNNIAPETVVLGLPYLFRDRNHLHKTLDGPIGDNILKALEPHGMIGLGYYDSGERSFYTVDQPVRSLADLKGLKIRVQNTDLFIAMMEALGADPTPMSFGQVYEGLLTGVIDGAENNWPSFAATRHFEAAQYYTLDRHSMAPEILVISKKRWISLSLTEQQQLRQAAKASVAHQRQLWTVRVQQAKQQIQDAGVTIIDTIDTASFSKAMAPVYERYRRDPALASLIDRIRETH